VSYKYEDVVHQIEEWITTGVLVAGERIPSVRAMSARIGYSTVTVHQAYSYLLDKGVLEARPRSGFYVSPRSRILPGFERSEPPEPDPIRAVGRSPDLAGGWPDQLDSQRGLGALHISNDLPAHAELHRAYRANLRHELKTRERTGYPPSYDLRDVLARVLVAGSGRVQKEDIQVLPTFAATIEAALDVIGIEGRAVLVETPTDLHITRAVLARRAVPVEIYSHPVYGLDPAQLEHIVSTRQIDVLIISPNCHAPTGVTYAEENVREVVKIAARHGIRIIENTSGTALCREGTAVDLTRYSRDNSIVRIGSFATVLGAEFGLGWLQLPAGTAAVPAAQASDPSALLGYWSLQRTIGEFIDRRGFEAYVRSTVAALAQRVRRNISTIFQTFPDGVTVSQPTAGHFCWIRGPKDFDSVQALERLRGSGVSFVPGPAFSVTRSFGNFIALNLSMKTSEENDAQLAQIGRMLTTRGQASPEPAQARQPKRRGG
jgi:DNA-binding transcriptional MocR family regulator